MKKRTNVIIKTLGLATLVAASVAGCGKSKQAPNVNLALDNLQTSGTTVTTALSCQGGGRDFGGYCVSAPASDLINTCLQVDSAARSMGTGSAGLTYTTESGNAQVCMVRSVLPASFGVLGYVPRTNGGRGMAPTGLRLRANDRLQWSGGSGGYGYKNGTWITDDCHRVDLNGIKKADGQMFMHDGQEGGLYGEDASGRFKMGKDGSRVVQSEGMLSLGFNAPSDGDWSDSKACTDAGIHLIISHCEDASGVTRTCP